MYGNWISHVNLIDLHFGTDLGLLRSKAVLNGDNSNQISD